MISIYGVGMNFKGDITYKAHKTATQKVQYMLIIFIMPTMSSRNIQ